MNAAGRALLIATAAACLAALVISIYPGLLNDLIFFAALIGVVMALPVGIALVIYVLISYRRGDIRISWAEMKIALLILSLTFVALYFYLPLRISFAACRGSFEALLASSSASDPKFDRRIGPYGIDQCLVDDRGGTYFRVHEGGDGIGPDTMSYGFCHLPDPQGSPFGAAKYRTYPLGNDWHWFRASDDWF